MATNGHGGPRTPVNPAPVSGPGRLSRRTDGQPGQKLMAPTGMPYGDHQALMAQERTAPMSQADPIAPADIPNAPSQGSGPGYNGPGMGDPTQRPGEPVTHGVDIGAGAGPEAMPQAMQPPAARPDGAITQMLSALSATDTTGTLGQLYLMAQQRGV